MRTLPLIVFCACFSLFTSKVSAEAPPAPAAVTPKDWELKIVPVVTSDSVSLDGIRLIAQGDKILNWELTGTCTAGTSFQVAEQSVITCTEEGKWKTELRHRNGNDIITITLTSDPEKKQLRYLLHWTRSDKTENVMRSAPAPTSVVQAYRDGEPVTFVDMEDSDRQHIVLKNFSPLLESDDTQSIEKVELFVSSGPENYQVTLPLEKDNHAEIPWELWGPKIEKPGRYQYRTTFWKGQRDYLGVLNDIEFGHVAVEPLQLNLFAAEIFGAYQPESSGTVYSLGARWTPRVRVSKKWSLRFEGGFLMLKQAGASVFPALELLTGVAYGLRRVDLLAGIGWQLWFSTISTSAPVFSGGALFYVGEKTRKVLLRAHGIQARYSFLPFNKAVHVLRVGLEWRL